MSHRRGLSLDTHRQQLSPTRARTTIRQDYTTVSTSTTNNTGLSTTQQHVLREAQQQRTARPGPSQPNNNTFASNDDENFLLSPHQTPQSQRFVDALAAQGHVQDMGISSDPYLGHVDGIVKKGRANFGHSRNHSLSSNPGQELEFFAADSGLSTPSFVNFPDSSPIGSHQGGWISEGEGGSTQRRRSSRRISNGIMDRVARFENIANGMDTQRPVTPPHQNMTSKFIVYHTLRREKNLLTGYESDYLPPTPMETPHDRMMKHEARPNRFSDDYDESMEETIKAVRGHRSNQRNSGIFDDMRQQAESAAQTPQRANTMPMGYHNSALSTPDFMSLTNLNDEFVKIENGFDGHPTATTTINMPSELRQQASPMTPHTGGFGNGGAFDHRPELRHPNFNGMQMGAQSPAGGSSPSHRGSPHRRTESIASITSAASIASINIEETKTETGVTLQDIAGFIEGPDPHDGKWVCLYDSCGKKFGRKENIKSHVQTHLNDRQYQCPTCKKCFVRQHDLKRHAKIHTGIKPYPCECGNSFARHDALTRHRQRGMCVGAFDGVVRKVVKRGRPRKHRPGMEDRREKRERTRRKNTSSSNSPSSASSQSGYSDSSAPNSPCNDFEGMLDDKEFPDMMGVAMGASSSAAMTEIPTTVTMDPTELAVSSAPMPSLEGSMAETLVVVTPEQIHSPSAMSSYSHRSHASIGGGGCETADDNQHAPLTHPESPAKSVASHYTHHPGTPPELSASSSPPPTEETGRFFNLDPNSSGLSDMSLGMGAATSSGVGGVSGMSLDDDMLLFANEDGLVQLDRDMMLGAKFDEDYDAVTMFTDNDDVFFGSV